MLEKLAQMICSALSRLGCVSVKFTATSLFVLAATVAGSAGFIATALARQGGSESPVIVQPGAPGEPSKTLPADTHASCRSDRKADVEFMQGMIMHHSQAVEMTALISSHTENKEVRALGAKISSSQSDEIKIHEAVAGGARASRFRWRCRECREWICRANVDGA